MDGGGIYLLYLALRHKSDILACKGGEMWRVMGILLIVLTLSGLGHAEQMISDEASSVGIVHVLCNAVFERIGFNVTNAYVDPSGTHVFTITTKDDATTYVLRGRATLSDVEPLYTTSAQATRLNIEFSDETKRTKLWATLKVEEAEDGKTLHSCWTATFMREGAIPLNGYLVENETISIKEGNVTFADLPNYLLEAPPGAVVRLERTRLTAIGNETYRSVTAEYCEKKSPEEILVTIETWLSMLNQGIIVSGKDTLSIRLDSRSVDLLGSVIRFAYIVFDKDTFKIEVPIVEYKLTEKKRTLSTATDGSITVETDLAYAATNPQYGTLKFKEEIAARIVKHTFHATTSWAFHVNEETIPTESFSLAVDPVPAIVVAGVIFAASFIASELATHYVVCCENCPVLQTKEGTPEDFVCEVGASTAIGLGVSGAAKAIAAKVGYKGALSLTKVAGRKVASWLGKQPLTRQAAKTLAKVVKPISKAAEKLGISKVIKEIGKHSIVKDLAEELAQNTIQYLIKGLIREVTRPKLVLKKYTQILMNQPGFNEYRWYNEDFSWTHTLPSHISPAELESVELEIEAWDVDSGPHPDYEFDRIYLDSKYLGVLQGRNEQWSTTTFTLDRSDARQIFADRKGVVYLDIDSTHNTYWWAVTIRGSTMTFYYWEETK